jgi:hypothetical protein
MEGGIRAIKTMVLGMGCPSSYILTQRKEEEGGSNRHNSHSYPKVGRKREKLIKSSIS